MEITPSEILFSKPQFTVFDEAFSRLSQVINDRRMVSYQVLLELLEHLQFDLARINELFHFMSFFQSEFATPYCRKSFFTFLRLASIIESKQEICKKTVIHFEESPQFTKHLSDFIALKYSRDLSNVVIPPPPMQPKKQVRRVVTAPADNKTATATATSSMLGTSNSTPSSTMSLNNSHARSSSSSSSAQPEDDSIDIWTITADQQQHYVGQFEQLKDAIVGRVQGRQAKQFFLRSNLPQTDLAAIWKLADIDEDGMLSLPEFCIAMQLVVLRRQQVELPDRLPPTLAAIFGVLAAEGHWYPPTLSDNGNAFADSSMFQQRASSSAASTTPQWTRFTESPDNNNTIQSSKRDTGLQLNIVPPSSDRWPMANGQDPNDDDEDPATASTIVNSPPILGESFTAASPASKPDLLMLNSVSQLIDQKFRDNSSASDSSDFLPEIEEFIVRRYKSISEYKIPSDVNADDAQVKRFYEHSKQYFQSLKRLNNDMLRDMIAMAQIVAKLKPGEGRN